MDSITIIPIDLLIESPTNPRKTFDEGALQELADNIKANGILQPLRVRDRVPELFKGIEGASIGKELIYGHRRLRGARLAGLTHLPGAPACCPGPG